MSIERQLRTGGDPRALADYAVLREELSKLTHPARPDVNWQKVEQLCLNLFQQNGIELQTASWYTQARARVAGISGLNEGLAILEALISRQWPGLWPQPVHARMEILSGLSQRLQQTLRSMTLDYHDLSQIYQAEKLINALCEVLQRLELKHVSQLEALSSFMHGAAVRLENMHATSDAPIVLPAAATENAEKEWATHPREQWVYVAQAEPAEPQVTVAPPAPVKHPVQWKGFIAGMVVTVLLGSGISAGIRAFYHPPSGEQLMATLPVLPKPLNTQALETLKNRQAEMLHREAPAYLAAMQQQTRQLATLSPRWAQDTGSHLVGQALMLWPDNPATAALAKSWTQQLNANAVPLENLSGWQQANTQLQQLADKLNGLDEQRGKYMTVSQLKSSVFAIQQALNSAPPVEESLRKLADLQQQKTAIPPQLTLQLDNQFTQLLNRYALLTQALPATAGKNGQADN
ncbi:VasL domain-containing protein [Rahnella victoriana]|uniref:Type VI secretion system ImpA family N-terminal domain-containing protein n=1 Tax=Rahnella victoriana TaxID=1510570 RepID=A0ABS0DZB9_9GAMM|nr:VasL domain-containing protein [Rahnella victoriana]MBF7957473.1 type VI secretion system ImpA family N-terminal domain-containing protein [Rahnella victoriana]